MTDGFAGGPACDTFHLIRKPKNAAVRFGLTTDQSRVGGGSNHLQARMTTSWRISPGLAPILIDRISSIPSGGASDRPSETGVLVLLWVDLSTTLSARLFRKHGCLDTLVSTQIWQTIDRNHVDGMFCTYCAISNFLTASVPMCPRSIYTEVAFIIRGDKQLQVGSHRCLLRHRREEWLRPE